MRLLAIILCLLVAGAANAATFVKRTMPFAGETRAYCDYIPPGAPSDAPMVLYLHGALSSNCQTDKVGVYWANRAQVTRDFIVVAPQAPDTYWNACSAPPETCANPKWGSETANRDDVGWMRDLLALYAGRTVYVSGLSAGGMFAYLLACHIEGIAAIHVVAGVSRAQSCPGGPVPLIHMHGNQDLIVPWEGDQNYPPAQPGIDQRAAINGCGAPTTTTNSLKARTETVYPDCRVTVFRYSCQHGWPGQTNYWWDVVFLTYCSTNWRAEYDALEWFGGHS